MQEGTGFSLTPAAMGQMQAHNVGVTAQDELGRAAVNSAAAMGGVLGAFEKMQDYNALTKANLDTRGIQSDMEADFGKRLQAAPGTALSFMNEDGTLNRDKVDGFAQEYKEKFAEVQPSFWDMTKRAEWEAERDGMVQNAMKRMTGQAQLHELNAIKRTGEAALNECELNDDAAGYANEIRRQVDAGVLTEAEGRVKMLKFGKGRLRRAAGSGGRVRIDGSEYGGLAAALRAQQVRDGYKMNEPPGEDSSAEAGEQEGQRGDLTLGGVPEEVSLKGAVGMDTEVATPGVQGDFTLDADGMREATAERGTGDEWLKMGDFSGVLSSMNQGEVDGLTSLWVQDGAIVKDERQDGTIAFAAGSATAPAAVERVAAVATEQGAINPESARAMVARMVMDAVTADPEATPEALCGMFDKSGIYEALGDGDAEVGKVRTMQVVHEMKRRGAQGALVLTNKSIEQVVEDRVNEPSFGEGADWYFMADAKERVRQGGLWGFRSRGEGKQETAEQKEAWGRVYGVYQRYHSEYKRGSEGTREELSKNFDGFVDWYVENKMEQAAKEYREAARDWYAAKVYEGLLRNVDVEADGKAGYGSYASDVAVMRDVLKQAPPRHLGAEERMRMLESRERDAERRSEAFRQKAAADYEQLRGMKAAEKEHSAQAVKAGAAAAAKAKREEEREQKRLEAVETRKRNAARALPRQAEWVWDGADGADGELPACTVPEAEYKRLVEELGYDGTQVVYVQVQGAKLQVTGANKKGRMLLNAAAVAKVQKKPNAKKGERWKYEGNLGYSYYFKNVSANN